MNHTPVMLKESIDLLTIIEGQWYVDGTFGAGGHSTEILNRGGRVLALDKDPAAADHAQSFQGSDFHFKQSNFIISCQKTELRIALRMSLRTLGRCPLD